MTQYLHTASDYLDNDEWGVIRQRIPLLDPMKFAGTGGEIFVPSSAKLSEEQCKFLAKYWNERQCPNHLQKSPPKERE